MCVELVGLPCFSTLFLYCPWFPFLSLSFRFVTSLSFFGRCSDSVASPFHSATGSPFGPSSFLFSLFALLVRTPIDLSLCLHPPASFPLLLQSAVPYCCFLSSRGFSFLPPACCRSPSCVRCPSRFTFCYFPSGASLRSLLLSFLLRLLPAVPHGSSILLMDLLLFPPRSWAGFHRDFLYLLSSLTFAWALPYSFSPPVGFPFHASSACFSSWPHSVLSLHSFISTPLWLGQISVPSRRGPPYGPSLRCWWFHAFFLMVSLLVRFSWCPFSSVPISLLPSLRCVCSPLLRRVFLEVSLPLLVAGWHSRLCLFCFSSSFLWLSHLRGFPSSFFSSCRFLLFCFHTVAVCL